ncbi:glycoside hydrolase family protein [Puniceicoccus vermicola]
MPNEDRNCGVRFVDRLRPLGPILDFSREGWTVWDCAPILHEGRVHVFFTRWRTPEEGSSPDAQWYLGSEIVHAVSDDVLGPYEIRQVVLRKEGGDGSWDDSAVINPKIYRIGERFALCYTGCRARRHDTQAIGLLVADSLDGPWTNLSADAPIIAPGEKPEAFDGYLCNNPAMLVHPSGEIWIYYKGRPRLPGAGAGPMRIGLATAKTLEGLYVKYSENPVLDLAPLSFEDPFVWREDDAYCMLASELDNPICILEQNGGLLFRSKDGLAWGPPEPGYPSPRKLFGTAQRMEEPNILFDGDRPSHLFATLGGGAGAGFHGFVFEVAEG